MRGKGEIEADQSERTSGDDARLFGQFPERGADGVLTVVEVTTGELPRTGPGTGLVKEQYAPEVITDQRGSP